MRAAAGSTLSFSLSFNERLHASGYLQTIYALHPHATSFAMRCLLTWNHYRKNLTPKQSGEFDKERQKGIAVTPIGDMQFIQPVLHPTLNLIARRAWIESQTFFEHHCIPTKASRSMTPVRFQICYEMFVLQGSLYKDI